jgi:hypothetical protein
MMYQEKQTVKVIFSGIVYSNPFHGSGLRKTMEDIDY